MSAVAYAWEAESGFGTGKSFCAQAARNVFSSRHAIVIGPTPPGTGVTAACDLHGFRVGDVADNPSFSALAGHTVDPHVDDSRSRLYPIAAYHFRATDGGHQRRDRRYQRPFPR